MSSGTLAPPLLDLSHFPHLACLRLGVTFDADGYIGKGACFTVSRAGAVPLPPRRHAPLSFERTLHMASVLLASSPIAR